MTLLRKAAGDLRVADLEVLQPTLDELYPNFDSPIGRFLASL